MVREKGLRCKTNKIDNFYGLGIGGRLDLG